MLRRSINISPNWALLKQTCFWVNFCLFIFSFLFTFCFLSLLTPFFTRFRFQTILFLQILTSELVAPAQRTWRRPRPWFLSSWTLSRLGSRWRWTSRTPTTRTSSEKEVSRRFGNTCYRLLNSLNKCQLLLDRQDSPYSQLLATTTLTKLVSRPSQVLSLPQRITISKLKLASSVSTVSLPYPHLWYKMILLASLKVIYKFWLLTSDAFTALTLIKGLKCSWQPPEILGNERLYV